MGLRHDPGATVVARARALIGVRFRPQGRSREAGLDCVGVVAAALGLTAPPDDYRLRTGSTERILAALRAAGLRAAPARRPGDVLIMASGPGQLHLGIWTGSGLVHADARLRCVVERPGPPPWRVLSQWRSG
ncbi:MAG: peptidoglycan endopeptidase [Sphingosinicella sp.]|uniref:peptidoglycan endopeptidase n=1 Tax=Sphingosinicella sp. TaxID=1917971 RepID=UPI004037C076